MTAIGKTPVLLAALSAAVLIIAAAADAAAQSGLVGKDAPPIDVREWYNCDEPLSMQALKGKAVVIVYFGLRCDICQCVPVVQKLGQIHKKHQSQGLVAAALHIHDAAGAEIDAFCIKKGLDFPVGHGGYNPAWSAPKVPHAFLVDPSGQIVWDGPDFGGDFNAKLGRALSQVDVFGEGALPKSLATVKKMVASRQFGKAIEKLIDFVADPASPEPDRELAAKLRETLEAFGEREYMRASSAIRMRNPVKGMEMLDVVATQFKEQPVGRKSAARLKEVRQEEEHKPFIEAEELYRKFRDSLRQGNERGAAALAARLIQKHADSHWSKAASGLLGAWDKVK